MDGKAKPKLNYRFHNPNTPEATTDFLMQLFVEVNMPKAEAAIRAAAEEAAAPKDSVLAKLHAPMPEQLPKSARRKSKVKEPER